MSNAGKDGYCKFKVNDVLGAFPSQFSQRVENFLNKEYQRLEGGQNKESLCQIFLVNVDAVESETGKDEVYDWLAELIGGAGTDSLIEENAGKKLALGKGESYGFFLFLSLEKSYKKWGAPPALKRKEFFIRAFISYELGRFAHYQEADLRESTPLSDDLCTKLMRLIVRQVASKGSGRNSLLVNEMPESLRRMRKDVAQLWEIACGELQVLEFEKIMRDSDKHQHLTAFVKCLAALYRVGRGPHDEALKKMVGERVPWLGYQGKRYAGSFELVGEIKTILDGNVDFVSSVPPSNSDRLFYLQHLLRGYEICRDLARWLAAGASYWAHQAEHLKILIVDNEDAYLAASGEEGAAKDLSGRLRLINQAFNHELPLSQSDSAPKNHFYAASCYLMSWGQLHQHLHARAPKSADKDVLGKPQFLKQISTGYDKESIPEAPENLLGYELILIEVEFSEIQEGKEASLNNPSSPDLRANAAKHFTGSSVPDLQRLVAYLDDQIARGLNAGGQRELHRPRVMAFSRSEHIGYIQQCLSLGADAYIPKNRVYQLPARVAEARLSLKKSLSNRHDKHRIIEEPRGRKSNFRLLYQLLPSQIRKLHSREGDLLVRGHLSEDGTPWDKIDEAWLCALPKADLHYHLGTCISLPTIQALALNTSGYLLLFTSGEDRLWSPLEELVKNICAIVLLTLALKKSLSDAEVTERSSNAKRQSLSHDVGELLLLATACVLLKEENKNEITGYLKSAKNNLFDKIIDWLTEPHRPIARFEVAALLVAALSLAEEFVDGSEKGERAYLTEWRYLSNLNSSNGSSGLKLFDELRKHALSLCKGMTQYNAWQRRLTGDVCAMNFEETKKGAWHNCFEKVTARVKATRQRLLKVFAEQAKVGFDKLSAIETVGKLAQNYANILDKLPKEAEAQKKERFEPISLEEFVVLPAASAPGSHNLLRYLRGAGLLGAEHLQYPENILLVGRDIVRQSIRDNIVYSEVRCETTGYTAGGMSSVAATDLLCAAFDLATVYYVTCWEDKAVRKEKGFATIEKPRWIRVNVLLGAKRHKPDEEARKIVNLLIYYLQKTPWTVESLLTGSDKSPLYPDWWGLSRVVGFDLSGDESKGKDIDKSEQWRKIVAPLFEHCAQITIHAGEAATAESIWQAIYQFGARRIGHGLRLRENQRLLNFAITEGICMEMCPISNQFTNAFEKIASRDGLLGEKREHYPLRYYLEAGLDVCISTDNRQLHRQKTLTHDYLCAARLAGGLTRWEILRLVKAGFKHAFLPKHEIELLLREVEQEIYRLVTSETEIPLRRAMHDASRL